MTRPKSSKVPQEEDMEVDDFDFLASQQSNNSDDQALEQALAQHYAVAREKKKKEKEKKFIEGAARVLKKDLSDAAEEVKTAVESLEDIYSKFLMEYAATEDRIHHLWSEVLKEQQALATLIQVKHEAGVVSAKKCEKGHIAGLSKAKAACQEFEGIIRMMIPEEDEEGDDD